MNLEQEYYLGMGEGFANEKIKDGCCFDLDVVTTRK